MAVLEDGCEVRLALPFLPQSDVVAAAFAALHFSVSGAAITRLVGGMHRTGGALPISPSLAEDV